MAKFSRVAGTTSQSVSIFIQDSSSTVGAGLSGLAYNTAGLACYYTFTGANTTAVSVTLATLALVTTAFSSGGFIEIDATHMKGLYRLDLKDTSLAASKGVIVTYYLYGATNMAPCVFEIELTGVDNQDGVHFGITALPNAAAAASGGLLISGSNAGTTTLAALTVTGALTVSDGIAVTRSTTNGAGFTVTGNGTGAGTVFTSGSGATGDGFQCTAASTAGNGHKSTGAGTGHGTQSIGGATSGCGVKATGGGTGDGWNCVSGGGATGNGISSTSGATGGYGLFLQGNGAYDGARILGGATGNGILIAGGGTSGDGINISTTIGHGLNIAATGTSKHGITTTGGNGGTSDGLHCAAGTGGVDIRGNITGNLVGTVSTLTTYTGNTVQTGDAYARLGAPAGASVSADVATLTGIQSVRRNTAQAGSGTTITLDAGASATNSFYINDLIVLTGGTGAGQSRFISAYVGATKVATVATWATNPDATTTFAIVPYDAIAGATAPTAAQNATAVWEDLLAGGDFGTASSIGKLLSALTFTVSNQVDVNVLDWKSATAPAMTGDAYARLGAPAGASIAADLAEIEGETDGIAAIPTSNPTVAQIATGVWQDTTAGDFTLASSVGKSVMNGVALGTGLTINAYTGNTVQTGDAYARLGAPAGASIAADLAEIEGETDGIAAIPTSNPSAATIASAVWQDTTAGDFTTNASVGKSVMNGVSLGTGLTINAYTGNTVQTGDAYARLGAPAGASVSADIAEIEAETDGIAAIPTNNGTSQTGDSYALLTGVNTELASVPASTASLVNMIKWLYLLARNKLTQTSTTQIVKANDGATTVGTSTVSDDGTTATRGNFS